MSFENKLYVWGIVGLSLLVSSFARYYRPPFGVRTVVIDAGHGGKDPGCHGTKHLEKEVALSIALKLGQLIEKNCQDVKVVYTRKTDVFLELQERAAIANRANANFFICIHCNASVNTTVYGSETYIMGLHKTKGNLDVAKRENSAILLEDNYKTKYDGFDPNSDEGNILMNMYQNTYLEQSLKLATHIQGNYKSIGRVDKGVKQAGFLVLWKTAMPSLLTETGFLTNVEEERFLGSEYGQQQMAISLFKSFRTYKDQVEGTKSNPNKEIEGITDIPKPEKKETPVVDKVLPKSEATHSYTTEKENIKPQEEAKQTSKEGIDKANGNTDSEPVKSQVRNETSDIGSGPTAEIKEPSSVSGYADKVVYKIQIVSSDKRLPLNSSRFKGLENIEEYQQGSTFKYTVGSYLQQSEANKQLSEIKANHFKDAFLVAFKNGKRIK